MIGDRISGRWRVALAPSSHAQRDATTIRKGFKEEGSIFCDSTDAWHIYEREICGRPWVVVEAMEQQPVRADKSLGYH
jgi:hypothetical protein